MFVAPLSRNSGEQAKLLRCAFELCSGQCKYQAYLPETLRELFSRWPDFSISHSAW